MANERKTTNGHFEVDFLGHVQTEEILKKNFEALDKMLGPKLTADDIGKPIVVVERADGTLGFGFAAP